MGRRRQIELPLPSSPMASGRYRSVLGAPSFTHLRTQVSSCVNETVLLMVLRLTFRSSLDKPLRA
ncbi:hypothetical protein D3C76_852150 [compost metagenome]